MGREASTGAVAPPATQRYLVFALGGVDYAIDATYVRRLLTHAPGPGSDVRFLGERYPFLDLRALFGLPEQPGGDSLAVLVEAGEERAALLVDRSVDLVPLDGSAFLPVPGRFAGRERQWFRGLAPVQGRLVPVLAAEGILQR